MGSVRAICVVGVLALSSVFVVASAAPAAANAAVTADPTSGLGDGQSITITVTGYFPQNGLIAGQCSAPAGRSGGIVDCDVSNAPNVSSDAAGTAVFRLRVKRTIFTQNGTVDCLTAADPCIVGIVDGSNRDSPETFVGVPITFDANAPPPSPPDVAVSPSDGLVDHQNVTVNATGFVPGEEVVVGQCAAVALATEACEPLAFFVFVDTIADPTGAVAVGLAVRRVMRVGGDRIDCAAASGTCAVVARAIGGPIGDAPIAFDGSTPLPPPPTMTVDPSGAVADRQILRLDASGFTPDADITIVECRSDAASPVYGCPFTSVRSITADRSGSFSTTTRVVRTLDFPDAPVHTPRVTDCAAAAGRCVLWAFEVNDEDNAVIVPLQFDPAAPPLPLSIDVSSTDGLADGQTVHVTGGGFPPGTQIFVAQCVGSAIYTRCDPDLAVQVIPDDEGRVETDYTLHRFILSTFDCASAPGACTVAVAFLGIQTEAASMPLTFDASAASVAPPPAPPVESADPGGGTPATESTQVQDVTDGEPLARTGTDVRDALRLESMLMIVGGLALIAAAELRWRARRRTRYTAPR